MEANRPKDSPDLAFALDETKRARALADALEGLSPGLRALANGCRAFVEAVDSGFAEGHPHEAGDDEAGLFAVRVSAPEGPELVDLEELRFAAEELVAFRERWLARAALGTHKGPRGGE